MTPLGRAAFLAAIFLLPSLPLSAHAANGQLTSENIARRADSIARTTNSSGYCYAAVSKALNPLGLNLRGTSAYEARDLLLKDKRFTPLVITHVDQLVRGDIIVYQRSNTHPHGHISVYEGDYEEASDHISAVTHTEAYGGATVFRLNETLLASNQWSPGSKPTTAPPVHRISESYRPSPIARIRSTYYRLTGESLERAIIRRATRYLFRS